MIWGNAPVYWLFLHRMGYLESMTQHPDEFISTKMLRSSCTSRSFQASSLTIINLGLHLRTSIFMGFLSEKLLPFSFLLLIYLPPLPTLHTITYLLYPLLSSLPLSPTAWGLSTTDNSAHCDSVSWVCVGPHKTVRAEERCAHLPPSSACTAIITAKITSVWQVVSSQVRSRKYLRGLHIL